MNKSEAARKKQVRSGEENIKIEWSEAGDEALLTAMLDGAGSRRDAAWHELLRRYEPTINKRLRWVVGNCARMFRSSDTFEDIKADFHVALLSNDMSRLRKFDPAKGTLTAWLSMIVQQTALTHLTKRMRHGVPDPIEAITGDDHDAGYGEEDHDRGGDGQIGARWIAFGL